MTNEELVDVVQTLHRLNMQQVGQLAALRVIVEALTGTLAKSRPPLLEPLEVNLDALSVLRRDELDEESGSAAAFDDSIVNFQQTLRGLAP